MQPDGSFLATRVEVISTHITTLTLASGTLMNVSNSPRLDFLLTRPRRVIFHGWGRIWIWLREFCDTQFQVSGQFENLVSLPFAPASMPRPWLLADRRSRHRPLPSGGSVYVPATTMTLLPQTIDGTVSAISSEGNFTTYTVTLAPYDLFPQFAVQPGQTTLLTNPNTVVVYADSNAQMLNSSALSVGGVFRFYGLVFNDNGTLRMDCAQINDGVPE